MIRGVVRAIVDVNDQDRARDFWVGKMGFELVQDSSYGDERWLEVRPPDGETIIVLMPSFSGEAPPKPPSEDLPTSNIFFYCDDLKETHHELKKRGVAFAKEPVQQHFGWWSVFMDTEGNRFALTTRNEPT